MGHVGSFRFIPSIALLERRAVLGVKDQKEHTFPELKQAKHVGLQKATSKQEVRRRLSPQLKLITTMMS